MPDRRFGGGIDAKRTDWGVSFAWMGGGVAGVEGDIGYSPDFYGKNDVGGSSLLSLMGNVLFGVPFGGQKGFGVRPFGLVGIGVLRSDLESFKDLVGFDNTEVAWDFGGGVIVFFGSARRNPWRPSLFPDVRQGGLWSDPGR